MLRQSINRREKRVMRQKRAPRQLIPAPASMSRLADRLLRSVTAYRPFATHGPLVHLSAAPLQSRGLLLLQGKESSDLLQGLVTNDVRQAHASEAMLAFLLNPSGRIMADLMIYARTPDSLLLECDKQLMSDVQRHLTRHRLRKKAAIQAVDELSVWSLFAPSLASRVKLRDSHSVTASASPSVARSPVVVNDNRLPIALYRVIAAAHEDWSSVATGISSRLEQEDASCHLTSEDEYRDFRYRIGFSEGSSDYPVNVALPLESNGDFLQGISFQKGCYVGQELTARSHHTGVVRKRLMPVWIDGSDAPPAAWVPGHEFRHPESKKLMGRLRSVSGTRGLALLYVDLVTRPDCQLFVGDSRVATEVPFWWPTRAELQQPRQTEL